MAGLCYTGISGFTGTITYTQQVSNGQGGYTTQTVTENVSGTCNVGSPNTFSDGGEVVRMGDVQNSGDLYWEATSASSSVFVNGQEVVRAGDPCRCWNSKGSGTGTFNSGSNDVTAGG